MHIDSRIYFGYLFEPRAYEICSWLLPSPGPVACAIVRRWQPNCLYRIRTCLNARDLCRLCAQCTWYSACPLTSNPLFPHLQNRYPFQAMAGDFRCEHCLMLQQRGTSHEICVTAVRNWRRQVMFINMTAILPLYVAVVQIFGRRSFMSIWHVKSQLWMISKRGFEDIRPPSAPSCPIGSRNQMPWLPTNHSFASLSRILLLNQMVSLSSETYPMCSIE